MIFMQPKLLLSIVFISAVFSIANAQEYNPYKSIGKKGKVVTAYGGKFVEVFDYDSIQRVGSVLINIRTKKIVQLLNANKTFDKFSDNSSSSRWYSVDPLANSKKNISVSPYVFVADNPILLVDPDGKDWFNYREKGEKKSSWHFQEGHTATYTNTKGKEVTTRNGYGYLISFKATGKNDEGATVGTLTIYNQSHADVQVKGFSGSDVYGLPAAEKGNYFVNLSQRDAKGPQEMNEKRDNPTAFMGIQAIPNRYIYQDNARYDIGGAYGTGRMRLLETDANNNISDAQTHGYYIHGKLNESINWTHGCICDKSEQVFNYFWSGEGKDVRGYVPVSVE